LPLNSQLVRSVKTYVGCFTLILEAIGQQFTVFYFKISQVGLEGCMHMCVTKVGATKFCKTFPDYIA